MIVRAALASLALAAAATAQERPALRGTVHDRDDGQPIARVLVEVVGSSRYAWSNSDGGYELSFLESGPQRIRLSRLGYEGLELEVLVPESSAMRLDVALRPRPVALKAVRLESGRGAREAPRAPPGPSDAEIGARTFTPDERHLAAASGEPDALWATASVPDVVLRPDQPSSLHVRGGSADQNLILLDGIPIFAPHHGSGVLSSLPPDAIAQVTLHGGVPPASLGGALSSVIEIHTRDVPTQGLATRGGIAMRGVRGSFAHALPRGLGGFLIAGRRSYRPGFPGDGEAVDESGFGDVLAKLTLDLPIGGIDVVSFASRDRLGFAAALEEDPRAADGGPPAPESGPASIASSNRFGWDSRALGAVWRRTWTPAVRAEVRAWHSEFDADLDWAASPSGVSLRSGRSQQGLSARLDGRLAGGSTSGGVSLERMSVRYDLASRAEPVDSTVDDLLVLDARTELLSAFLEQAWSVGDRGSVRAGLRGMTGSGLGLLAEPRLSLSFAPSDGLLLSAGYARTRQSVQSLRNEESILDAVAGIDLPVVAGMAGVPVARSDQLAAALATTVGAGTTLEVEAYTRWLDGLVLVAPSTSQPFALSGFETGSGRVSGAAVLLERRGSRVGARAAFALSRVVRRTETGAYHTTFERPRSFSAALDWRPDERTAVTGSLLAAGGSPTTLLDGSWAWEPFNALGGEGELEGSPQLTAGSLNGERLPNYVRVDLGVRREWAPRWLGERAVLAAHADILNVLGRRNVVGYALDPNTGARRPLALLGRSLTFGLEWRY